MSKTVIAIDVDDVLAMENDAVRRFANQRYGHSHTEDDYLIPGEYWSYWEQAQGVDKIEGSRRYKEYMESGIKAQLQVMDGAIEAIEELKQRFELVIITSREANLVELTHAWLAEHFAEAFKEVAFVAVWHGTVKGSKAAICKELKADYLIDDNPGHLGIAAEVGIKGLLFGTYGWSIGRAVPDGVTKVADWHEVREFFRENE